MAASGGGRGSPGSPWAGRALHFIGIGGAGMSGLALVAHALGASVSGSDQAESAYLERLREAGLEPVTGHRPEVPADAEVVVSAAVGDDNVELAAARAAGRPVLRRGELLAEVARMKRSIVVAGTHGKTTTASMIAHALIGAGTEPAYLIGGELRSTGTNASWGAGEWIVVESDESDRSFLELEPEVAVVTNVELDHHVAWPSLVELREAFARFASPASRRVVWAPLAEQIPALARAGTTTFGIDAGDVAARELALEQLGSSFRVDGATARLAVPGEHNVLNALAALAACAEAGIGIEAAASALGDFAGAARRFEDHGATPTGARVFDDYAHHPTEVRATLEAARRLDGRLVACFQPHLYSRTARFAREFGQALALADVVAVLDVYPARERASDYPGVSGLTVAARAADAADGRPVYWLPTQDAAAEVLARELRAGDVLVTLGAGDVDRVARTLTGAA